MVTSMVTTGSLVTDVPDRLEAERFDPLLDRAHVRIERIISTGQVTPVGQWLEQDWDEWVMVASGEAKILFQDEAAERTLRANDYVLIPAGVRHRVTWTAPDRATVWLAVHIHQPISSTR